MTNAGSLPTSPRGLDLLDRDLWERVCVSPAKMGMAYRSAVVPMLSEYTSLLACFELNKVQ